MDPRPLIRFRMPELDSARGIAVLGVLIVHAFVFKFGYTDFHGPMRLFMRITSMGKLGVNLFFVLSGFLITGILLQSRNSETYYKPFYWKRVCRILPPYCLTILVVAITSGNWKFALASSLFLANVIELLGMKSPYGPLWSLAVEEHFYLLWPAVIRNLSRQAIAGTAIFLIIAAPTLRYDQVLYGWPAHSATWFQCDGLAAGALLRLAMCQWPERRRWKLVSGALMLSGILGILLLAVFHVVAETTCVGNALQISCCNVLFGGFLVFLLLLGTGRFQRFANPRPLAFLGYISYGLYLYHLAVYEAFDRLFPNVNMFVRFGVVATAGILLAWLSRASYEEFFFQKKGLVPSTKRSGPAFMPHDPTVTMRSRKRHPSKRMSEPAQYSRESEQSQAAEE